MGRLRQTLGLAAIFSGGIACAEDPQSAPGQGGFDDLGADHEGLAVSTDIREEGALRARVFGDTVHTWENSGRMVLFPVSVDLYDEDGGLTGHLTADRGELDTNTQQMTATGSVVVVNTDSTRMLLTEELHFDPRNDRIWSDVESTLVEETSRLQGLGFTATSDLRQIEMTGSTGETTRGRP